ncbi:MAG: RecQ family ATP-dependent DNA helicase [Bacteroidota bacterium]|nr:RecQ family ATP-dependent DNA helicase [Bacteroidota bacterium]
MADELTFSAAARLGSLSHPRVEKLLANSLCSTVRLETDSPSIKFGNPLPEHARAMFAILDKMLIRGKPTLCNWEFEQYLLRALQTIVADAPELGLLIWEYPQNNRKVGYHLDFHQHAQDGFLSAAESWLLCNHYAPEVVTILPTQLQQFTSIAEDRFLTSIKNNAPRLVRHLYRQVRLADLCPDEDLAQSNARVDFVFQCCDIREVIEIDGAQHQEPGAQLADQGRDELLQRHGWTVHRIHAYEAEHRARECIERWLNYPSMQEWYDRYQQWHINWNVVDHNFQRALRRGDHSFLAYALVVMPTAFHQCLRSLVQLYLRGALPYDREHRVLIVEEDARVAYEAYVALWTMWKNLAYLYPAFPKPPRLQLLVFSRHFERRVENMHDSDINTIQIEENIPPNQEEYDFALSYSAFLGPWQRGANEQRLRLPPARRIAIRRGISLRDYRELEVIPGAKFAAQLDDIEEQLRHGREVENVIRYAALQYFLQLLFRFPRFRQGQLHGIVRLLQRRDTIILLPTGAGKSLIFQFASMLQPGATLIVDPLLSLMVDQVDNLRAAGFDTVELIGSIQEQELNTGILERFGNRKLLFLYVSPERLQMEKFRAALSRQALLATVPYAVIDEAHCLSEWGHDFRIAYLHLPHNLRQFCGDPQGNLPTIVALTGTASYMVLRDLQVEMGIESDEAIIAPPTFDRPELRFRVRHIDDPQNRLTILRAVREELPTLFGANPQTFFLPQGEQTCSGIIFVPHVDGPLGAVEIARELGHRNYFTGGAPRYVNQHKYSRRKLRVQRNYKQNLIQELVATKSFGMGIDKPNIRYTIHYVAPLSIEAFYQEAGRAGRDGRTAYCIILYSNRNRDMFARMLYSEDHQAALRELRRVRRAERGDLGVLLWFVLQAYQGSAQEKEAICSFYRRVIRDKIEEKEPNTVVTVNHLEEREGQDEKSIYRLMLIGIISDYTVEWFLNGQKRYTITACRVPPEEIIRKLRDYLRHYKPLRQVNEMLARVPLKDGRTYTEVVEAAVGILIDFIYSEIVARRKQALRQMCELCELYRAENDEGIFRQQMLNYLQESEFTPILKEWLRKGFEEIGLQEIEKVLTRARQSMRWSELLGTVNRMLTDAPSNLALLLLRLFVRLRTQALPDILNRDFIEFVRVFNSYYKSQVHQGFDEPVELFAEILNRLYTESARIVDPILQQVLPSSLDRDIRDKLYLHIRRWWDTRLPMRNLIRRMQLAYSIEKLQPIVNGLRSMLNHSSMVHERQ